MPKIEKKDNNDIKMLYHLKGHESIINRLAWSPDGKMIASPSDDMSVRIWDADTGRLNSIFQFNRETKPRFCTISCVAWSPDGRTIVLSNEAGENINAINIEKKREVWKFKFENPVGELAWSPNGSFIAIGSTDYTVYILDAHTGTLVQELVGHESAIPTLAWSPDGNFLASGDLIGTILIYNSNDWQIYKKFEGHSDAVWSISWSKNKDLLATGSADRTIRIWNTKTGRQLNILEGHIKPVKNVSFSHDDCLLATKASDGVKLWNCDSWKVVHTIKERSRDVTFSGLKFHPSKPQLATLAFGNKSIRVWELDIVSILKRQSISTSNRYSNAKVVLVGDTGVGKSGLGLVLTGKEWIETGSTHGRHVWVFDSKQVENPEKEVETREIILWDLAGQPDYRLIHQLHLTEVALALILFDSRSQTDPFSGVSHWHRALRQAQRVQGNITLNSKKFLVAARIDVGRIGVSKVRINKMMNELGFDNYYETSAKEGWGITDLINAVHQAINWDELPKVSSTDLFQNIKAFLVAEKESGRLLSTVDDLYRAFIKVSINLYNTDELRAQFETCIGRVESRGLIQRLSFGNLVLLQPELQDVYASSIANAVKDEPDGLGCIIEQKARIGEFRIPESERISDQEQEKLLLISTIEELLKHEIALREQGEDGQYLVFPSQLTRENPDLPDPEGKAVIFNFEGPVLNIYATLAVRLSHSGLFKKKDMWKNASTYTTSTGGTCGMFLQENIEGCGQLTLFFDMNASEESKFHFEEYVKLHLIRRALPDSIKRRRIFVCHQCGTPVTDLAAQRRRERRFDYIQCNVCEPSIKISLLDREQRIITLQPSKIIDMDRSADAQRKLETAASILQGKVETGDFDVFLCHNSEDKNEVKNIGESLKEKGILPWLDEWELRPGIPWQQLLEEQIGKIKAAAVIVGNKGIGPWQQHELNAFLREFVSRGCPVIPVLLNTVPKKPELPVFLRSMTWVDFRKKEPNPINQLIWGITGNKEIKSHY